MQSLLALCFILLPICLASSISLSTEEKQALLDAHNLLRAQTARGQTGSQPRAKNMMLMEWSDALADKASTWAVQCRAGHDSSTDRLIPGYTYVGQNWAGSYNTNDSTRVIAWFNEHNDYTLSSLSCTKECGHYTQIVWAKSVLVGCAAASCSTYPRVVVCNYAPGGNFLGQKPYTEGGECTECMADSTFCMAGLCATKSQCDRSGVQCSCTLTASSCQNGASFDSSRCLCNCPDGFYGSRCDQKCQDEPGWEYTCNSRVAGNLKLCNEGYGPYCSKTCGLCKTELGTAEGSLLPRVLGAATAGGATVGGTTTTAPETTTTSFTTTTATETTPGETGGCSTEEPTIPTTTTTAPPPTTTTTSTTAPPTTTTSTKAPPTTTTPVESTPGCSTSPVTSTTTTAAPTTTTVEPTTTTVAPTTTTTAAPTTTTATSTTTSTAPGGCSDVIGASECEPYKPYCGTDEVKVICGKTCGDACAASKICKDWSIDCAANQCWCPARKALCKVTCGVCTA